MRALRLIDDGSQLGVWASNEQGKLLIEDGKRFRVVHMLTPSNRYIGQTRLIL